jgi:hypothetical protein
MARRLILLPLLLIAVTAHAQTGTVYGTVNEIVGDQYYPIPFAKVSVKSADHTSHPVVPDIDGKFTIDAVPAGVYSLHVTAVGFDPLAEEIELVGGDSVRVRIRLGDKAIAGIMIEDEEGLVAGQRLGGSGQ